MTYDGLCWSCARLSSITCEVAELFYLRQRSYRESQLGRAVLLTVNGTANPQDRKSTRSPYIRLSRKIQSSRPLSENDEYSVSPRYQEESSIT